jgi:hypothetical protein
MPEAIIACHDTLRRGLLKGLCISGCNSSIPPMASSRLAESKSSKPFLDLATTPDVEIRAKGKHSALMHLKSYQIDGHVLRHRGRDLFSFWPQAPRR